MNKKEQYENIIKKANEGLSGLVDRLENDIEDYNDKINPIFAGMPPSCGSMKRNPYAQGAKLTPQEKRDMKDAYDGIANIADEILSDPYTFPEGSEIIPDNKPPGEGRGDETGRFNVPGIVSRPPWFDEIKAGIGELIGQPDIAKKDIDYTEVASGVLQGFAKMRKQKTRITTPNKQIYVLLDTSASMTYYKYKGMPLMQLLGSFIPKLGEEYDGWFWQCDACSLNDYETNPEDVPRWQEKLENLTTSMLFRGGGGTRFEGAFTKLGDIERTRQKENKDYEMVVVFFSDMEVGDEWASYEKYGPTNQVYVTTENRLQSIPQKVYQNPNIKVIGIDIEK